MMRHMSASRFRQWAILEKVEPFGEYARALQMGLLCSLIANVHKAKETPAFCAEDFMPETMRTRQLGAKQTPAQIKHVMMMFKAQQDAYLARKKKKKLVGADGNDTGARTV